jgi:hypothetical protein
MVSYVTTCKICEQSKNCADSGRRRLSASAEIRFGPLPSDLVAQLGSATAEQFERWGDRVLDAASLDGIFRP